MVVVWGIVVACMLMALPGRLVSREWSGGCCGSYRWRINLPAHPPAKESKPYPTTIVLEPSGPRGLIDDGGQRAPLSACGEGAFYFAMYTKPSYWGFPMWVLRVDERRYDATYAFHTKSHRRGDQAQLSEEELSECKAFLAQRLDRSGWNRAASIIRSPAPPMRVNALGILVNVALLICAWAFSVSLVRACRGLIRQCHAHRAMRRHLCPTCRYDLRGLPSSVCPECGTGFASDEPRG